jgi:hypothetical protein
MLSLAGNRNSILMWSYYAEGHTGLCVHFDSRLAPIGNAQRVDYQDEYPTISGPLASVNLESLLTTLLCTKSSAWRHEEEYRLINMPDGARPGARGVLDDIFLRKTKNLMVLPPKYVVAVTIGASMPSPQIEALLRICYDRKPAIPVYKATPRRARFELDFEQIS